MLDNNKQKKNVEEQALKYSSSRNMITIRSAMKLFFRIMVLHILEKQPYLLATHNILGKWKNKLVHKQKILVGGNTVEILKFSSLCFHILLAIFL